MKRIQENFVSIPNADFAETLISNLFRIFEEGIYKINSDNYQKKRNVLESFEQTFLSFKDIKQSELDLDNTVEVIVYQSNRTKRYNNLANLIIQLFEYLNIEQIRFIHEGTIEDSLFQSFFTPSKFIQYLSESNKRAFTYNFSMSDKIISFERG